MEFNIRYENDEIRLGLGFWNLGGFFLKKIFYKYFIKIFILKIIKYLKYNNFQNFILFPYYIFSYWIFEQIRFI